MQGSGLQTLILSVFMCNFASMRKPAAVFAVAGFSSFSDRGLTFGINGGAQRRPLHAIVRRMTSSHTGLMFWFIRKRFVGSYFFLSSTSRLYVAP